VGTFAREVATGAFHSRHSEPFAENPNDYDPRRLILVLTRRARDRSVAPTVGAAMLRSMSHRARTLRLVLLVLLALAGLVRELLHESHPAGGAVAPPPESGP